MNKREKWYHEGLKFQCSQCGACCSGAPGFVWVDDQEIQSLAQAMEMDIDTFHDRFVRRVGDRFSLIEYPDGDCIFLEPQTRGCMVYDARPTQCRTWPFWNSNLESKRSWQATCRVCPGAGEGKLYSLKQIEIARNAKDV
ncbi:MAG: YkgJ family cysteine cluster protein [Planctomycetales bacterium]|nr:YkgJ family cysteine cluster protein [Planctomycetales bacterium]